MFIQFDIENLYPSISRKLFNEAISFAKLYCDINDDDLSIILQSRKTLLFFDNNPWVKRYGNENFDVPMGCFDGAEVCDLVGLYILKRLSDDGLGIFRKLSGPNLDRKRKEIIKLFKE